MNYSQQGGILLMVLVIFGVFVMMMGASIIFINRQYHATVNQEQKEKAFYLAEAGTQYVLFLVNDGVYTTQELLDLGTIEDKTLTDSSSEEAGAFTLTFEPIEGTSAAQGIKVTSTGQDAAARSCQAIEVTIGKNNASAQGYVIDSWNQLLSCP